MSVLGKQSVKIAASKKCKMQLDAQHITTSNFMELQPVYYRHMIAGERIKINEKTISRLAPLSVPTFGRANLNLRAFFVPYRTVVPYFNEFIADTYFSNSSTSDIPQKVTYFKASTLLTFFKSGVILGSGALTTSSSIQPSVWDFYSDAKWYTFTTLGKRIYKIFTSLGYRLVLRQKTDIADLEFNALALLSFARIYFDWYSLPQYRNSSSLLALQKLFSKNDPTNPYMLTNSDFVVLGGLFAYSSYSQDYFTSAWDNPVSPNTSNSSSITGINDLTYGSLLRVSTNQNNFDTPTLVTTGIISDDKESALSPITEYSLHLLHALNNYAVRHNMSGARAIDRLLVDYGIQLRSERLNRSVFIGSDIQPLQIGDVTQTSNTAAAGSPSNLGDYGGRGYIQGLKEFEYESDEFGIFIICSTIVPSVSYVQGFDRNNLHLDKLDFFNPSFDSLGVQGIAKGELYVSNSDQFSADVSKYKNTFGFTPRYSEYKVGRDWLTGDFSLDSANVGRKSWFLARLLSDDSFAQGGDIDDMYHNLDFCTGSDASQYNRIFNYTEDDVDPFYLFFNFNVSSYVPALPLYDTYTFDGEENHESVTIDTGGTKLN